MKFQGDISHRPEGVMETHQLFLLGIAHEEEGHRAVKAELVDQIADMLHCCCAESAVLELQKEERRPA